MKEEIQKIIENYKNLVEDTQKEVDQMINQFKNNKMAQKMLNHDLNSLVNEEIDKIMEEFKVKEEKMQVEFQKSIEKEKERIIHLNSKNDSEYTLKINNALSFLNAVGDTLDDETANMMLEDFKKDYKTMLLFKQVIENNIGVFVTNTDDPSNTKFPKTFANFNNKLKCLSILDEILKNSKDALKYSMGPEEYILKNSDLENGIAKYTNIFYIPKPTYSSLTSNDNINDLLIEYEKIDI